MFALSMNSELVGQRKKNANNQYSLKINLVKWDTGLKIPHKNLKIPAIEVFDSKSQVYCVTKNIFMKKPSIQATQQR
jgi:hypothetical protein